MELSKTFDPKSAEEHWFQLWIDRGYFKADPSREGDPFSIVIPPPNVTGQLHLGHALNVTLQDVIVRTRRMQGFNTLWVPGTDHAGIATQNVVEREIAKDGKSRHDLGRDRFVERVWEWKETYGGKILHQLRRLGASCDWSRERFTLDPGLSRAVTRVFVRLYRDGLIYRGRRMINWCPRCETALSDLEVEHKDAQGSLWHIRYPLADGSGSITVATTRPETMLGDTAVAVNRDDDRYRHYVVGEDGTDRVTKLILPIVGREIPLIGDEGVDRTFGTGALKVTPAHDRFDLILAQTHRLDVISVMDERARMNENAGNYRGLTREDCRRRIAEDLDSLGLLVKTEPHPHKIGVCSRCDTVVEPRISEQWFMRMYTKPMRDGEIIGDSLAEGAIKAVENGWTRFHPTFWENTYFSWMRNLEDWCISRQIWWGHRIPAYWCVRCVDAAPIVAEKRPTACPQCGGADLRQDEDVLDTWFSSGLWPFSTLGWPDATPELKRYYPTSLLLTGFDIIFFWVARMMMLGTYCMDDRSDRDRVPFREVYITPLVRDQYGKKMTKSRGNVVDPLEIMEKYGTDAVRFTLAQLAVQGRDLILSDDRLAASRAFANKIWNAARFVMMNLADAPQPLPAVDAANLGLAERWILSRLDNAVREVTQAIDAYEFNRAALIVYQFIWHEFCDWYIELAKDPLKAGGASQAAARYVLVECFDRMLRILHPFMPFISEEIWQALRPYFPATDLSEHLAVAKFPTPARTPWLSPAEETAMSNCIAATQAVNSLRSLLGWNPGQRVTIVMKRMSADSFAQLQPWIPYLKVLAKSDNVVFEQITAGKRGIFASIDGLGEVGIEEPDTFDFEIARKKLRKQLDEVKKFESQHEARLNDENFRRKADAETVTDAERRHLELGAQRYRLTEQLQQLEQAN